MQGSTALFQCENDLFSPLPKMMFPLQNLRFRWWRELVDIRKGIHMLHARYVSNSTIIHRNAIFVFGQSIVHQQQRNEPKNISFSLFSCKLISIIYLSVRRMRSEQVTIQCGDAVKIPQKKKCIPEREFRMRVIPTSPTPLLPHSNFARVRFTQRHSRGEEKNGIRLQCVCACALTEHDFRPMG